MDTIFCNNVRNLHFIGIGGISMSGLAKLAHSMGYRVTGSDLADNEQTRELRRLGIPVYAEHREQHVEGADVVVFSSAVGADNPELRRAVLDKICTVSRGKFLGLVARTYRTVVAVSGAHGKTTAAAIIADCLRREGRRVTYHLGGVLRSDGENTADFGRDIFVCEACEYKRNFLSLAPTVGVVLNVDFDHPDYYRDIEDVRAAYRSFAARCGTVIGHVSAADLAKRTFGRAEQRDAAGRPPDLAACDVRRMGEGYAFTAVCRGERAAAFSPSPLRHNVENTLAALAVLVELGIPLERAATLAANFCGVRRRFERLELDGVSLYSDYAHHPKQIEGVLRALKEEGERVVCVFEPHTFSRTVKLFCEFVDALALADEVCLLPVFAAREPFVEGVIESLRDEVGTRVPCRLLAFDEVVPYLREQDGVKVVLGAGAFDEWARRCYLGEGPAQS